MARLDQAVEAIIDAIVAAIQADVNDSGSGMDNVAAVVRGDRARPMPKLPAIWVVPEAATNDPMTYGDPESWTMPVGIAALVKDDDPEAGGRECARLASLARSAAIRDRDFGLSYVIDTTSQRFDGSARSNERNRNLFWSDATVVVTFTVEE